MDGFVKIAPENIGNAMQLIGKEWMLITVRDNENGRVNAMTASWGAMGVLWNKNICVCFVRPQRHTYTLLEREDEFSIAFLDEDRRDVLAFCGKESGRNCNKPEKCGLTLEEADGVPFVKEARLVLICRKLYVDDLAEEHFLDRTLLSSYKEGDYHRFYVCEIKEAYQRGD